MVCIVLPVLPQGCCCLCRMRVVATTAHRSGAIATACKTMRACIIPGNNRSPMPISCISYSTIGQGLIHLQMYTIAEISVDHARQHNQRTLDVLSARCTFYLSLAAEATGRLSLIRSKLLRLHATAVLNHDDIGQETLLNLLLHNYLHDNLVDQAEKFRAQAQRPEAPRSNQQYCRYLFYLGRIRAVQLEYSDSKECLQQAARKVPRKLIILE